MRSIALGSLLALGLACCVVATAQDAASVALEECASRFEETDEDATPPQLEEIEELCPDLKSVLESSPYAAWLPEEWWAPALTPEGLLRLRELVTSEPVAVTSRTLDTSGVAAALATLGEDPQDEPSWWDRVREWLISRLQNDPDEEPSWGLEWLEKLAAHELAVRIVGYVCFALIMLSAVWVVLNELKASGVFGSRSRRPSRFEAAREARAGGGLTLDDIERADPANRPSLLLGLLLGAVARRQDRAIDVSHTHRELATRIALETDWQRTAFGQLLRCAERVRYAPTLPASAEIDAAVQGGRRLLGSIAAPAGAAAT